MKVLTYAGKGLKTKTNKVKAGTEQQLNGSRIGLDGKSLPGSGGVGMSSVTPLL